MSENVESSRAPEPVGAFPQCETCWKSCYFCLDRSTANVAAKEIPRCHGLDSAGNIISYDIEKQCRAVFAKCSARAGRRQRELERTLSMSPCSLTNLKRDFPIYNRLYGRTFCRRWQAKSHTYHDLKSGALPTPIAIELKVIAAAPVGTHRGRRRDTSQRDVPTMFEVGRGALDVGRFWPMPSRILAPTTQASRSRILSDRSILARRSRLRAFTYRPSNWRNGQ